MFWEISSYVLFTYLPLPENEDNFSQNTRVIVWISDVWGTNDNWQQNKPEKIVTNM
jgi:hypothetical protein